MAIAEGLLASQMSSYLTRLQIRSRQWAIACLQVGFSHLAVAKPLIDCIVQSAV